MNPKKNKSARRIRRAKQQANETKMMELAKQKIVPCKKCTMELQKEFDGKIKELYKEYLEKQCALIIERNNKADEIRKSMRVELTAEKDCTKHYGKQKKSSVE
jgi:hypothetical protein